MVPQFFQCPGLLVICPFFHAMDCSRGPLANPQMYHLQQSTGQNFCKRPESLDRSARDQPFPSRETFSLVVYTIHTEVVRNCNVKSSRFSLNNLTFGFTSFQLINPKRATARYSALQRAIQQRERIHTVTY